MSRNFHYSVRLLLTACGFAVGLGVLPAGAADKIVMMPVKPALETPAAREKLDGSVGFYFGDTAHPQVVESLGTVTSRKKTNAFAKSDAETCQHVALSTFIELQHQAQLRGGNAVINIVSVYDGKERKSDTEYECRVGFLMSGVALKGEVVKLAK
ncbi:excinuclease ATPase-like protein [Parvibaculum lavamentivorans DS-1]|uniref:Excinuclease ATPase-like protein n=1 Tax=Parvibaculum lavamentivorans (strain DS-1 / DSM 13023 / NCIMB 13966) TaxID=402881 RepID=A7HT72_PARL1|nr:hypothetical protein [Parvibaculum lavamentivorans]ABS63105.1 excinuclease ATPase-like protein [Parvibaculum lavamentivorans DS-1]